MADRVREQGREREESQQCDFTPLTAQPRLRVPRAALPRKAAQPSVCNTQNCKTCDKGLLTEELCLEIKVFHPVPTTLASRIHPCSARCQASAGWLSARTPASLPSQQTGTQGYCNARVPSQALVRRAAALFCPSTQLFAGEILMYGNRQLPTLKRARKQISPEMISKLCKPFGSQKRKRTLLFGVGFGGIVGFSGRAGHSSCPYLHFCPAISLQRMSSGDLRRGSSEGLENPTTADSAASVKGQVNLRQYGIPQLIPAEQFQQIHDSFSVFDRDGGESRPRGLSAIVEVSGRVEPRPGAVSL